MDNIPKRKRIIYTDIVSDITFMRQNDITRLVIQFLWHKVIHLITAMSYDKKILSLWFSVYKCEDIKLNITFITDNFLVSDLMSSARLCWSNRGSYSRKENHAVTSCFL